jgi:putative Mg2+ transporter-C (MgtC) family protein
METLSIAEFALRLGVGVGCGALIGIERQWQARRAGLRTNALVATGATLFVLYAVVTNDSSPTRVASYVVSGVGFLGGGVILREGFNVHGLNTAATLWCSAAVGVLAAGGHFLFALIATGAILGIHLLGRPLGHLIDRDNVVEEDEDDQPYQVQLICRRKSEKYARAQIRAARYPHRARGGGQCRFDRVPAQWQARAGPPGGARGGLVAAGGRSGRALVCR